MSKAGISFEEMKTDMFKNEEFITQAELAKRVGTQKSNISRLESGNYNPSLDFLAKIAESLGKEMSVKLN